MDLCHGCSGIEKSGVGNDLHGDAWRCMAWAAERRAAVLHGSSLTLMGTAWESHGKVRLRMEPQRKSGEVRDKAKE